MSSSRRLGRRALMACTRCRRLKKSCERVEGGGCVRCHSLDERCQFKPVRDDPTAPRGSLNMQGSWSEVNTRGRIMAKQDNRYPPFDQSHRARHFIYPDIPPNGRRTAVPAHHTSQPHLPGFVEVPVTSPIHSLQRSHISNEDDETAHGYYSFRYAHFTEPIRDNLISGQPAVPEYDCAYYNQDPQLMLGASIILQSASSDSTSTTSNFSASIPGTPSPLEGDQMQHWNTRDTSARIPSHHPYQTYIHRQV